MNKAVLIYSGGMDSTTLLYWLVMNMGSKNILAITFNYQSKHNEQEFLRAQATCEALNVEHKLINLSDISKHLESNLLKSGGDIPEGHYAEVNMKKTVVPFRNGIMLSIACGIAESQGATKVYIGNHAGDHAIYPDCRATFISAMNEAMAYGTYNNVNLISPFQGVTKTHIATLGNELNVDWALTYSCYKGGNIHCGLCSTCYERREAFYDANLNDPTEYLDKTNFIELRKKYEDKMKDQNEGY